MSKINDLIAAKEEHLNQKAGVYFDLSKYINANGHVDLVEWLNSALANSAASNENKDDDSDNGLFGCFLDMDDSENPKNIIKGILTGCKLDNLCLPIFDDFTYSGCEIRNCTFRGFEGLGEFDELMISAKKLRFYNCIIINLSFLDDTSLRSIKISNSTIDNLYISKCNLDALTLENCITVNEFELQDCSVKSCVIKTVSFSKSFIKRCSFIGSVEFLDTNLKLYDTDANIFDCLHKAKNMGCINLDEYLNEKKISEAKTRNASIVAIPYSMNGTTTNADKYIDRLLKRGSFDNDIESAMLHYIIYFYNKEILDDKKKGYLDSCDLCVLPGGENIPQIYYKDEFITSYVTGPRHTYNIKFLQNDQRFDDDRTNNELRILDYLKDKPTIRVIGICRGLQLMAVFCGAKITNCHDKHSHNNEKHYMFVKRSEQKNPIVVLFETKRGKSYFKPLAAFEQNNPEFFMLPVNCQHSQQVSTSKLPSNVLPIAWSQRNEDQEPVIEACKFSFNDNWFGIQNHPESVLCVETSQYTEEDQRISHAILRKFMTSPRSSRKSISPNTFS